MSAAKWPDLDEVADVTEFNTFQMRKVAQELEEYVAGFTAPAFSEGYTTGSAASVETSGNLSGQEIGEWPAAQTFARTVGSVSAGGSPEGRIAVLAQVYKEFVAQYAEVIKTIRASAKEYDGANVAGGAGDG
ncbi:hypothetical protein ACFQ08_19960 [Streptosporangium algeriense]|uniref:PE domain-containing protein n=1 Tax=Streptosporangium algeriense TaxID=1682748 RepID=A0ABW3DUE3_9ACTN